MKATIQAARKVAERHGAVMDRCEVLQDGHTLVVRLSETLVARVVTDTDGPRKGMEWFTKETAIAAHLSGLGAPIIPLHCEIPWHAHVGDGFTMNFWQYVSRSDKHIEPEEIGRTLHQCHEALRSFPEKLPSLAILHESSAILESPSSHAAFSVSTRELLGEHIHRSIDVLDARPHQALHGDAHMGNLMICEEGLLWTDWEDAFCGPIEWDIASIIWNAKLLDEDEVTANEIVAAYESSGTIIHQETLWQCLVARAAVMSAWYPILYPNPDFDRLRKLKHRLDWLASIPV